MAWLKYYDDEQKRHPELHLAKCTPQEAMAAIAKLCRHFKVPLPRVRFTTGRRNSKGGALQIITLNRDCLTWLVVTHEFAHTWHVFDKRRRQQKARLSPRWGDGSNSVNRQLLRIASERWHGKRHVHLVDRACAYITKKGWSHADVLAPKAKPPKAAPTASQLREKKILLRAAQVVRLQRRIKALNTRLAKAKRSLAALQRARDLAAKEAEMVRGAA